MKKIRVVAFVDPIRSLKAASDTSLELCREFLKAGAEIYLSEWKSLYWNSDRLIVPAHRVRKFSASGSPSLDFKAKSLHEIRDFSVGLIRKDPPFDETYQKLCWLLLPFEKDLHFFNRPSVLLHHHEKMLPLTALVERKLSIREVIPTFLPADHVPASFALRSARFVSKPFLGYQGNQVRLLKRAVLPKVAQAGGILQPFLPEIQTEGDLRAFFFRGKFLGAFVRLPKKGSILSNLAQGGLGRERKLKAHEMRFMKKLGLFLWEKKIEFAGADIIGGKLNEVNITSPTGLVFYRKLTGRNLAGLMVKNIMMGVRGRRP